jgi:hypothetical protein
MQAAANKRRHGVAIAAAHAPKEIHFLLRSPVPPKAADLGLQKSFALPMDAVFSSDLLEYQSHSRGGVAERRLETVARMQPRLAGPDGMRRKRPVMQARQMADWTLQVQPDQIQAPVNCLV